MIKTDWSTTFFKFHYANPHMWLAYCHYAKEAYDAARIHGLDPRFSTKLLNERIRWEAMLKGDKDHITTNSLTAYYARLLMWKYPEYRNSFTLKRIDIDGQSDLHDVTTWNKFYWSRF